MMKLLLTVLVAAGFSVIHAEETKPVLTDDEATVATQLYNTTSEEEADVVASEAK